MTILTAPQKHPECGPRGSSDDADDDFAADVAGGAQFLSGARNSL
jgi:hypothetical protein